MMQKLKSWHKTKLGLLIFGLAELAAAYIFGGLALDRGSVVWYLLTLAFLVGALQHLFKFLGKFFRRGKRGQN